MSLRTITRFQSGQRQSNVVHAVISLRLDQAISRINTNTPSQKPVGMYIRSLLMFGMLVLLGSAVYGAGSYQRTRDGRTIVWKDSPARGEEATWSGKRDKNGYATGSGVLTWYKAEPRIVTGSNILNNRRYAVMINHYAGTMTRGKFKGAVTYVSASGKPLSDSANRSSRRKKATRTATGGLRASPPPKQIPTPSSEPIIVDRPERTSTLTESTPAAEESPPPSADEPAIVEPSQTSALEAKQTMTQPQAVPEESAPPTADEPPTIEPSQTSALEAKRARTEPATPEDSRPPVADEPSTVEPSQTSALEAKQTVTEAQPTLEDSPPPGADGVSTVTPSKIPILEAKRTVTGPQSDSERTASVTAEEAQTAAPPKTGTLTANRMPSPASEQQGTLLEARNRTVQTPTGSDDSLRSRSAPPFELPKPPRTIDEQTVARLDTLFQSAVKANDAAIMEEVLGDDFVLMTDSGASLTKADLIKEAQDKRTTYEQQEVEEGTQKVRIWRDTAVVTALLKVKGTRDQNPFDYKMWVSETYVRTPTGWHYVFGQPLKPEAK